MSNFVALITSITSIDLIYIDTDYQDLEEFKAGHSELAMRMLTSTRVLVAWSAFFFFFFIMTKYKSGGEEGRKKFREGLI
jgi:hypothetical protein